MVEQLRATSTCSAAVLGPRAASLQLYRPSIHLSVWSADRNPSSGSLHISWDHAVSESGLVILYGLAASCVASPLCAPSLRAGWRLRSLHSEREGVLRITQCARASACSIVLAAAVTLSSSMSTLSSKAGLESTRTLLHVVCCRRIKERPCLALHNVHAHAYM